MTSGSKAINRRPQVQTRSRVTATPEVVFSLDPTSCTLVRPQVRASEMLEVGAANEFGSRRNAPKRKPYSELPTNR